MTSVEVIVLAQVDGKEELEHASLEIPVQFHNNKTDLHFPLRGTWWAIQGSDWSDLHKQEVLSQAYAVDFAKLGADNRTFDGRGVALEDHYSWDQPVYATAGGKVAAVTFDMPDLVPGVLPDPLMFRGDPAAHAGQFGGHQPWQWRVQLLCLSAAGQPGGQRRPDRSSAVHCWAESATAA